MYPFRVVAFVRGFYFYFSALWGQNVKTVSLQQCFRDNIGWNWFCLQANLPRCTVAGLRGLTTQVRARPHTRPQSVPARPNPRPIRPRSLRAPLFPRRLIGGVELMQAIGLRLEENGTVLALREVEEGREQAPRAGGKWERVPDSALRNLDTAAKVKQAGVGHGGTSSTRLLARNTPVPFPRTPSTEYPEKTSPLPTAMTDEMGSIFHLRGTTDTYHNRVDTHPHSK